MTRLRKATTWRMLLLGSILLGIGIISIMPAARAQMGPTVQFSIANYTVNENAGTAVITVTLSAASSSTVTVSYTTSNGTAVAPSDYAAASGQLTFNPGETSKTFSVSIVDDTIQEPNETVNLSLSAPINAMLGTPSTAVLTIMDNDTPPPTLQFSAATYIVDESAAAATITVTLSSSPSQTVTVNFATSAGTAVDGTDYNNISGTLTFNAGQTWQTFPVAILNKGNFSGQIVNFSATLSNPTGGAVLGSPSTATVSIVDNDPAPTVQMASSAYYTSDTTAAVQLTVTLSFPVPSSVTVDYQTTAGSALAGTDYVATSGTLTFTAGQTSQTITVTLLNAGKTYGGTVDFFVNLTNPSSKVILGTAATTVFIVDNNPSNPANVYFTATGYTVSEYCGYAEIRVLMTGAPTATVTVSYATSDGTATAGVHYVSTSGTLTWGTADSGQTRSIWVQILHKETASATVTANLTLSNPNNATLGTPYTAVTNILDSNGVCNSD